jgi:hypothetical protein
MPTNPAKHQLPTGIPAVPTGAYSMQIGDADARRLQILGQFYDPMSSDFLEAASVRRDGFARCSALVIGLTILLPDALWSRL